LDLTPRTGFPTLSVLVPFYNSARYVQERLRSILWQNWPIAQIVIMDDASTDETLAEIARVERTWGISLPVIVNSVNSGSPCAQWQNAMSHLNGDLVWIAEADDIAHPHFLKTLVPAFGEQRIVLAYVNTMIIDPHENILCQDTREWLGGADSRIWSREFTMPGRKFLTDLLATRNVIINASGVLMRREVLAAVLRRLQQRLRSFRTAGDWLVYANCLRHGDVFFSPETLNACRRQSDSISFNLDPTTHFLETLNIQAYILGALQANQEVAGRARLAAFELANHLKLDVDTAVGMIKSVLGG
jgi:glycosyltransferase involved in cell wall biosynthesis